METPATPSFTQSQLTDILGLRLCGIFPAGKEPSIRTLREWTKLRRIPHHRVGQGRMKLCRALCRHFSARQRFGTTVNDEVGHNQTGLYGSPTLPAISRGKYLQAGMVFHHHQFVERNLLQSAGLFRGKAEFEC